MDRAGASGASESERENPVPRLEWMVQAAEAAATKLVFSSPGRGEEEGGERKERKRQKGLDSCMGPI